MTETDVKRIVSETLRGSTEKLTKMIPLLWGLLVGAFGLGVWVASQQVTLNALAVEVSTMKAANDERAKLEQESRTDIAVIKNNITGIKQDLEEIADEIRRNRL